MTDDIQLFILAALALYEIYAARYHDFPVLAAFWDWVARIAGTLANALGNIAMQARLAYFEVAQT